MIEEKKKLRAEEDSEVVSQPTHDGEAEGAGIPSGIQEGGEAIDR